MHRTSAIAIVAVALLSQVSSASAREPKWVREPVRAVQVNDDVPGTRLIGRVLATRPDGRVSYCTGTVVLSQNQSVVLTAGHCIHPGRGGAYYTNIQFAPGVRPGATGAETRPYGTWPVVAAEVPSSHIRGHTNGTVTRDVAVLVIGRDPWRRTITQALGGAHRVKFNVKRPGRVAVYGYPAAGRFAGNVALQACRRKRSGAYRAQGRTGPLRLGARCEMLHGASGGPWIKGANANGLGTVVSVTSATSHSARISIAPILDRTVHRMFNRMQRLPV